MTPARRLQARVAVVIGAGTGMGRAIAVRYAEEGAIVVAADINDKAVLETISEVENIGGSGFARAFDIVDGPALNRMFDECVERYGRLDILCNNANAGDVISEDTDVVRTSEDVWDRTFAVNVKGVFMSCKAAIPLMLKTTGKGAIVNTSSVASTEADVVFVAYGPSKAALEALGRSIATSHGRMGIRCNTVVTSLVSTSAERMPEEVQETYRRHRLVRDPGKPEHIAAMVAHLSSDEASYITGQAIVMDGGMSTVHNSVYIESGRRHRSGVVEDDFPRFDWSFLRDQQSRFRYRSNSGR